MKPLLIRRQSAMEHALAATTGRAKRSLAHTAALTLSFVCASLLISSGAADYALSLLSAAFPARPLPAQRAPLDLSSWVTAAPSSRGCLREISSVAARNLTAAGRSDAARRARCCIRHLQAELPRGVSRADADALAAVGFSADFLRALPRDEAPGMALRHGRRYRTCAVVSNAPSLRMRRFESDLAAEIDRSDAVFRLNVAPVRGFEKWVGARTTHRIVNMRPGVTTSEAVVGDYAVRGRTVIVRDAMYMRSADASGNLSWSWDTPQFGKQEGMVSEYMSLRRRWPRAQIFLNHPVFAELALRHLHTGLVGGSPRALSSGAQAVFLAMSLCDQVTSYEVASADPLSGGHRYYYDTSSREGTGYVWWHPFAEESGVLRMLASNIRDGTSIYEYNLTEDANGCASDART
jgi:hypothetical protein